MIHHGLRAMASSLPASQRPRWSAGPELVAGFDAAAAWDRVLDGYLQCSKA
jgi:hypothetical protein